MKKRLLILIAILLLTLLSCGKTEEHEGEQMKLTIPAVLFVGMSDQEIRAEAGQLDYLSCVIESDGSVTYTMTANAKKLAMESYHAELDEAIATLTEGEKKIESYESIKYQSDMTRIDIRVHLDLYAKQDHDYATCLFRPALMYQVLNGTPLSKLNVTMTFRDPVTHLILDKVIYRKTLSVEELIQLDGGAHELSENFIEETTDITTTEKDPNDITPAGTGVKIKGQKVYVTLPAEMFWDMTVQEIRDGAIQSGYDSGTVNEDGSVTYKMSQRRYISLLEEYRLIMEDTAANLLTGKNRVASFREIKFGEDYLRVDITVDSAAYLESDKTHAEAFYDAGIMYQRLRGIEENELNVIVSFMNEEGKVLDTAVYRTEN